MNVVWAYDAVVILTMILVGMNLRWVFRQYDKDRVHSRMWAHVATILLLGAMIIIITHRVVDRVMQVEEELRTDVTPSHPAVPHP